LEGVPENTISTIFSLQEIHTTQTIPDIGMAIGLERLRTEFGIPESMYLITKRGLNDDIQVITEITIKSEKRAKGK
jgi:hypothetical protein